MLLSYIPISTEASGKWGRLSVYFSGFGAKFVLLFSFLNLLAFIQSGHGQCTNADFSDGNFTGWTGTYGIDYYSNSLGCTVSNPFEYNGFLQGPLNDPCTDPNNHYCQIITSTAGGNDPFLSADGVNIPVSYPGGPGFSARIGNTWPNNGDDGNPDAESITYTYTPTAATAGFTYFYFPILNVGPGHAPAEQPYLHIYMVAGTTDTIQCATLNVDASNANTIGFDSLEDDIFNLDAGKIFYKNWTPVFIPLTAYIGQPVHVTFVTRSCNPYGCAGIHFAIAYINASCGPIALAVTPTTNCAGTSSYTLTAPAGAYTYLWTGPGVTGLTTQTVTATTTGTYTCQMTSGGIIPCTFTMDTTVTITAASNVHAKFSADTVCQGTATTFTNLSTAGQPLAWDFLNNGTTNSTAANPTYTFATAGTYPVKLTVGTSPCVADTTIDVVVLPPPTSSFTVTGPVCVQQPVTVTYTGNGTGADTYIWNFNGGTVISGSGAGPYQISWTTAGTKNITLTVAAGSCTSPLTTMPVTVTAGSTITLTPDIYICPGGSATLTPVVSITGGTYLWSGGQTSPTLTVTPTDTGHFYYNVTYTLGTCSASAADTVIVTKPNAGPDQTVTCVLLPGGSATMAGTGTGTWSPVASGNPGTAVITTPTSPTTTITGFTAAGLYSFVWTNIHGCTDTALVTVTAKPNAGPDQTVTCAVLPGGSATMAATGAGTWTPASTGNPGTAVITTPTSPTTTITTYTAPGIYSFIWTNASGCTDTAKVTVTAKPNAGPDQTVTCAILPGGSATMAATGAGTWTPASTGNPGTAVITTPTSPTTTITTYTAPGIYSFIWTNASGCTDTALVTVTAKPNAGPDQTVNCAVLPGGSATMAATGTGTWAPASAGNAGTATITTPASPTTTITTFSAAGTYLFVWTNASGCTDTAQITVTAKPNAGPDQTVTCQVLPGGAATMAATGAGTWTPASAGNPGTAVITAPTSPTTTITTYTAPGTYSFVWTNASGCTDTAQITVTAKPNAGPDQTVNCAVLPGGSATMAATGAGTWTAASSGNPGTAVITNATSPTTTITTYTAPGLYSFVWTNASGCTDTAQITVTAKPNAGPDQTVTCVVLPAGTAAMAATGTGTWTPASAGNPGTAVITAPTSPTTTITTFTAAGTYSFVWANASGCTDTAQIIVTGKPNAGPDQTVNCALLPGGSATMSATGTGTWAPASSGNPGTAVITTPTSPTTTITTYTAPGIYSFIWTNASGCTDTALITVTQEPTVTLAGTQYCVGSSATLTPVAAPAGGTYLWSTGAVTPTITTDTTVTSDFTVTYTLGSCSASATNTVTVSSSDAGPDQTVACALLPGGSATMAATGTGTWTPISTGNPGTASITNPTSPTTTITSFTAAGIYSFVWTIPFGCTDTATVTVTQEPTVTLAGAAYCSGGSATLSPVAAPAGGSYLWSTAETTPTITTDTSVTSNFSVTYTLGTCPATATATVTVYQLPTATVTTIPAVCTTSNGIAIANPAAGTPAYSYSWSAPGGTHDSISNLAAGAYQVTVTDAHQCTVTATGTVALQTPAIIVNEVSQHDLKCFNDATGDIYISTTDTARNVPSYTDTYIWSNSATSQDLTNVQAGSYQVTVTDQFGCTGSATYTLTQPQPLTGTPTDTNPVCFGYANGTAAVTPAGGSGSYHYVWTTTPAQTTQEATGLKAGSYTVTVTDDSACTVSYSVTLTDPLQITFGNTTIVNPSCYLDSNGTALVTPLNGIGSYTYTWSYNSETSNPAIDLPAGTYTVTATDSNGCFAATTVTLIQPPLLTVSIIPTNDKCFGSSDGSAQATAQGGTPPYSYLWSNEDTTSVITALTVGTYIVTASDHNGCIANASASITQPTQVADTLSSTRTNCPNSDDGTITAAASGGTGAFTYTLESPSGTILQSGNTTGSFTGVGYGLYMVQATDQNGCPVTDTITVPRAPFDVYMDSAVSTSCYGVQYKDGKILLSATPAVNGPFQYSIDGGPFQSTPDFTGLSSGGHNITTQDAYGCDTTFTVIVPEPLPAVLQILPADSTIFAGTSLQLTNVFGPYSIDSIKGYAWSEGYGLNCMDCPSPVASPYDFVTDYSLTVTYNQGCIVVATVQVNVDGEPPVYIPNAFSPNGDGVNDVWFVFGTGIKDIRVRVFNRWGEKIFETDDQFQGWDGTYKGELQPPGVYVYVAEMVYLSGQLREKHGSVTLIR